MSDEQKNAIAVIDETEIFGNVHNGMFRVVTSDSESGRVSSVTVVSPKGLNYIYNLMQKKYALYKFDVATLLSKIQELEVA